MNTLNPSLKHHSIIGVFIFVWGFLFAFFSRPFEHGQMDLQKWILVSLGFSLLALLSYLSISYIQKYIFSKAGKWNFWLEITIYILFYGFYSVLTYSYYKSELISGTYHFLEFFQKIIFNLILIMTPLIFFLRLYSLKLVPDKEEMLTIRGDNKLDILKIKKSALICISNAQNYVEIFYEEGEELKSKLIRGTLKKMQSDLPFLLQTHRSHLINPTHFKSWKDSSNIHLSKMEVPVSKNYKERLLAL